MNNVQAALMTRIPAGAPTGKAKVVVATLENSLELKEARVNASMNRELSEIGRAALVAKHVQGKALPALAKARRQCAYHEGKLSALRITVQKKATGDATPLDAEWRQHLRALPVGERAKLALTDREARGAALRAPGLSGVSPEVLEQAMKMAIAETCPNESAVIDVFEESQAIHKQAVRVLEEEIMATPFIAEPSGVVRNLHTQTEMENLLKESVGLPSIKQIALEEVEADRAEAA